MASLRTWREIYYSYSSVIYLFDIAMPVKVFHLFLQVNYYLSLLYGFHC